ncbi:MAG: sigma-54 dependent transcriptional regulator [Myxococcota bacterium]
MSNRILIVDDENSASDYLRLLLEEDGHAVRTTANGVEALIALETNPFDLVISDIRMPQMDGLELLNHMQQRWPALPAIMLTANDDISDVVEAVQLGAINYLVKPASRAVLSVAVEKALRTRPVEISPDSGVPELIGETPEITEVRHRAVMAARSDVHVMITGDTGTGKELVARAIHHHSAQSEGPFVAHNCALAPAELFESEFFGHRRGSFTGAERDHVGLLQQADGGVLFLDELEAMPAAHQAKLLRVIDDGEVRAVGAEKSKTVSVRFLAATNRDPGIMMEERTLREDLYYRLRGIEIRLPALAERRDDVPLLARHFMGEGSLGFTPDAMEALCGAPWPGNVRQLRNMVQGARAAAGNARIGIADLPLEVPRSAPEESGSGGAEGTLDAEGAPRGVSLRDVERWAIVRALEDCDGNRTRAAERLDIDRSTLRRKIIEYEIE